MLFKRNGDLFFRCDGKNCEHVFASGTKNFYGTAKQLEENDWHAIRAKGKYWKHYCPECKLWSNSNADDSSGDQQGTST